MSSTTTSSRSLVRGMRALLWAFAALTLLALVDLFVLSGSTERLFAWTINPALSAAFMGGGYGAGCVLVLLAQRERDWAGVRVAFVTIMVFTLLTLVATLAHLDRLHLTTGSPAARFAAYFWLAIYLAVPAAMIVLLVRQLRAPGIDAAPGEALPHWLRRVLGAQGAVMLLAGVALFVAPSASAPAWPWPVTPLTARAIASWLLALGIAALLAVRENDFQRLDAAAVTYAALGALQLMSLARYAGEVEWTEPGASLYTLMLLSIVATGAYGWVAARRSRSRPYAEAL